MSCDGSCKPWMVTQDVKSDSVITLVEVSHGVYSVQSVSDVSVGIVETYPASASGYILHTVVLVHVRSFVGVLTTLS